MLDKIKKLLSGIAPVIGVALGGPIGGIAMTALSGALLGKPDASENEIYNALKNPNADLIVKLKECDNNFELEMQRLGVDMMKLQADDTKSAREREMKLSENGHRDYLLIFLAILITLGFFGTIILVAFVNVDKEAEQSLFMLMGLLGAAFNTVVAYFFGSSIGSKLKDFYNSREKV